MEIGVIGRDVHMLEHANRDDPIEGSLRGAVILKGKGDAIREAPIGSSAPRHGQLFFRERNPPNVSGAGPLNEAHRQPAPTRADI